MKRKESLRQVHEEGHCRETRRASAGYEHKRGVIMFNFGDAYVLRMLVMLYSLRKHYGGPVVIFIPEGEPNHLQVAADAKKLGVETRTLEIGKSEKASLTYSTFKPALLYQSPYEDTLLIDTDLLFLDSPTELLDLLGETSLVLTKFFGERDAHLRTSSRYIARFFQKPLGEEEARAIGDKAQRNAYVNIGVMAVKDPKGNAFVSRIRTILGRFTQNDPNRRQAIDEYLVSALYPEFDHIVLTNDWNSADQGPIAPSTKILHFIRDFHRGTGEPKGRLWADSFRELRHHIDLDYWVGKDPKFAGGSAELPYDVCHKYPMKYIYQGNLVKYGSLSDFLIAFAHRWRDDPKYPKKVLKRFLRSPSVIT